jgi:hypothetical protein
MPGEAFKRELQHNLRRARRPAALALGHIEPLQKAAYVDKQTGKFRTNRIKRMVHALPGCNDGIRQKTRLMTARSAVGWNRIRPIRSCSRHEMSTREFGAQPLTGLQLVRLDHDSAVTPASAGKPG